MFNCRVCSNTPFASLFGFSSEDPDKKKKKAKRPSTSGTSDINSCSGSGGEASHFTDRPGVSSCCTFEPRSHEDIVCLCRAWENYVHPRAKEFWRNSDQLCEILAFIAKGCNKTDDPVLGDDTQCVRWYGELSEDNLPIIRMTRPGESEESQTYVNRALVFLYANELSFQELQAKPKKAFTMACEDPLCVNLTHISLDD